MCQLSYWIDSLLTQLKFLFFPPNIDDIFVKTKEHSLVYLLLVDSLEFLLMAEIQAMLE